tara:strand:- start:1884 stop:2222 length:339 start_codon:yes stop_codon:yes gene_type:complete
MSSKKATQQDKILTFGQEFKRCRTDQQKIEFFDSNKELFFTDSNECTLSEKRNIPKDIDDAFYVYANMKKLNESEFEELKCLNLKEHSEIFKIFLFDFCILNSKAYAKYFIN